MRLEEHFESSSTLQRNERVKLAASFWNARHNTIEKFLWFGLHLPAKHSFEAVLRRALITEPTIAKVVLGRWQATANDDHLLLTARASPR